MLDQQQIDTYHRDGYVVVRSALDKKQLESLQTITADYIEASRHVHSNDAVYDLDQGHTPSSPRLNRIKTPHLLNQVYWDVLQSDNILDCLKPLLGQNIRLHNSKLNTKAGNGGAPVHWHQDWGFYPHTNDDLLAIGIMLSDVGPTDGPLQVIPGSHKGPVVPHTNEGVFCGAVDPEHPDVKLEEAVTLTGLAGDMSIHHVRTLHGSAPNESERPRLLLLYECGAADAWPIAGNQSVYSGMGQAEQWQNMLDRVICGEQNLVPRIEDVPVVMPLPPAPDSSSLFKVQASGGAKSAFR